MTARKHLPNDITEKLDKLLEISGDYVSAGNIPMAIETSEKAWGLIPEPKGDWDFYPEIIARGMAEDHASINDIDGFKKWIEITHDIYDPENRNDHLVLMLEGESYFNMNKEEEAFAVFKKVHDLYGDQGFEGDAIKYLDFYKKYESGAN